MSAELASGDLSETQFAGPKSQVCSHRTSGWPIFGISFPFPSFLPCAVALCHCTADYVRFVMLTPTGTLPRTSDAGTSRADTWPSKDLNPFTCFQTVSKLLKNKQTRTKLFYTQTKNAAVNCSLVISSNTPLDLFKRNLKFHFSNSRAALLWQQRRTTNAQSHLLRSCPLPFIIFGCWHSSSLATFRANSQ